MHTVFIELKISLYKGTATRSWFWWNSYTSKAPLPKRLIALGRTLGRILGTALPAPRKGWRERQTRWVKKERGKRKKKR